ncbi:MAG: GNAT family N-acetyltransferase [Opitutaceae bacterium]|nr:GNAT family N-acetyltransferase [Opitutaceae bacterium]
MPITYSTNHPITAEQLRDLFVRSTLGERRPIDDPERIAGMLRHADLLCTAWDHERLVGVARSVTDFVYCCYLSDLAVDRSYQRRGIGRALLRLTQSRLHPAASLILLAAPGATGYYQRIGMQAHPSAWIAKAGEPI